MSGPKVVRIVTREEILEICNGMLARVDAALAEWTRVGRQHDCIDEEALAAAQHRRNELAALIAADRFTELQKQAPEEEAFLRNDIQVSLAKVAAKQAAARKVQRREREAAASLLRSLKSRGAALDPELERRLARGEAGALAEGFQLLANAAGTPAGSRDLAARLGVGAEHRSFADWLASQPVSDTDPAIEKIEMRIAELASLVDETTMARWRERLDEALAAEPARRALLQDGLDVETGRALTEVKQRAAAATDLRLVIAELAAAGRETSLLSQDIDALNAQAVAGRISQARSALEAHRSALSQAARRAAILEGLTGLGYEVTEGMNTTLADNGKLVLRSAARPDYGVEVSPAGERVQMRPVAFTSSGGVGPDRTRDRDAETIWCGDVSALQEKLDEIGGGLVIEKSTPIGATPLKRIEIAASQVVAEAEAPVKRERTLR